MSASFCVQAAAALLFLIGAAFIVLRRQLIAMLIGLELMINAANLVLVQAALARGDARGLAVALLVLAAAAAEAVVGIVLVLELDRAGRPAETQALEELQG
ncbi:MAG: NADH-quinone oxidoreductase subunit NuoK [Elusimicrobiota bacterium]|jgi:NADH-quinone oxidoreductase subunit K